MRRPQRVFSVETGDQLWTAPHARSGYESPEDLLVSGGLVWNAPTSYGKLSGVDLNKIKLGATVDLDDYENEKDIWKIDGQILNSAGNLVLHIAGNIQHFIGTVIGNTNYKQRQEIRNSYLLSKSIYQRDRIVALLSIIL